MGGHDVYSMSKGAAELVTASLAPLLLPPGRGWRSTAWRWPPRAPATWWAAATGRRIGSSPTPSRRWRRAGHPGAEPARRPPLAARARAARRLPAARRPAARAATRAAHCEAWNFGPRLEDARPVRDVVEAIDRRLGRAAAGRTGTIRRAPHEAGLLRLSIEKATARLGWTPRWHFDETFRRTVEWYRAFHEGASADALRRARAEPRSTSTWSPDRMDHKAEERRLTAEIVERVRQIARLRQQAEAGRRVRPRQDRRSATPGGSTARRRWPTSPRARWSSGSPAAAGTRGSRTAWRSGTASRHARLVNSGSSANLLAVATLTSHLLGDRRLRPGDEVITVAAGFPTTVAPGHPARPGAGLRRRHAARLQPRRLAARGGPLAADAGGDGGPHARQPLRPGRGERLLQAARALAGGGQLRRGRLPLPGAQDRHLRRPRHAQLLPAAPHDHGRGRRGPHQRRHAGEGDDLAARLGARLLVRRPAWTTPASSASSGSSATCPRATTTSTSTATSATT